MNRSTRSSLVAGIVCAAAVFGAGGALAHSAAAPRLLGAWPTSDSPFAVAADPLGDVWVAYADTPRIARLNGRGVQQLSVPLDPSDRPLGIATDAAGDAFVPDSNNNTITKYSRAGAVTATWDESQYLNGPAGIAVAPDGSIYVADTGSNAVEKFSSAGAFVAQIGFGTLSVPNDVSTDAAGNVYVADTGNDEIVEYSASGSLVKKWGSEGSSGGQFELPAYLSVYGSLLVVSDENNNREQSFSTGGQSLSQWGIGGDGNGEFTNPLGVSVDVAGNAYVADQGNARIQKFYLGPSPCSGVSRAKGELTKCGEDQAKCLAMPVPTNEKTCMGKTATKYARFRRP
jgi:tripartite motif-containing protein 71